MSKSPPYVNKMKCPFCKTKLKNGECKEYENLADHVCNPNATEYPLRPTFICTCALSINMFWDETGGAYGLNMKGESALNSHERKMERLFKRERFYKKVHVEWLIRGNKIIWIHLKSLWKQGRLAKCF